MQMLVKINVIQFLFGELGNFQFSTSKFLQNFYFIMLVWSVSEQD